MPGVVAAAAMVEDEEEEEGGRSFLWQYWEPGVRSGEIEVKTLEGGTTGAWWWGGGGSSWPVTQLRPNSLKSPPPPHTLPPSSHLGL